jgi:hypothetical protein
VQALIGATLVFGMMPGCVNLQKSRPVSVLVRDAETKKPLPGVEVTISYPLAGGPGAPSRSIATTDAAGVAHVHATPVGEVSVVMEAKAEGYLFEWKDIPISKLRKVEPAHLFEKVEERPVSEVFELYAGPHPTIEFVVPEGFKGSFRVQIKVRDDLQTTPGERCFQYEVPTDGELVLFAPPVLRHGGAPDFRARRPDGTLLTRDVKGPEIGFWYVKFDNGYDYFLVGTAREYSALSRAENDSGRHDKGSGQGGGKGHGRRHGGS